MFHAFEVCEKHLFPYYEQVRALNQGKEVFIVKTNIGVHHKARKLLALLIEAKDIKFWNTPFSSPDLNPIKHVHKDQKKLHGFESNVTGADKVIQETAEDEIRGFGAITRFSSRK